MVPVAGSNDVRRLTDEAWLRDALSDFDVVATLSEALSPEWTVDRELDPSGEISVVVLPACDTAAHPTFILYEQNGLVQVSAFFGEDWQSRRAFLTCRRAVAAIIAAAEVMPADHASRTSRTIRASSSVR